jgi:hypothetical protein
MITRTAKQIITLSLLLLTLTGTKLSAQKTGATVPWTTYEAEAGTTNGTLQNKGDRDRSKITYEASGRAAIELNTAGNYVAIKSTVKANRVTIRYSVPKGTTGKVALLINNKQKKDIELSSYHMWNDKPALPNKMCRYFDEIIIEADVKKGDEIRIVQGKDVPPSTIDFIDLEQAPVPLKKPGNDWLDVTSYGATANDTTDDTKAIINCITAASAGSKKVWIPAGNFYSNDQINIPAGVKVYGAGIWHTVIKRNIPASLTRRSFQMKDSTEIKNLKIDDILGNYRINNHEGIRFSGSKNVLIDGIWLANIFGAGLLGASATNITIKNCRLIGTYADAIHLSRASVNCLAENNLVRNSGDDGLAIVTYNTAGCHDIVYRNNTVWLNYWGRGITMIGGDNNVLEKNLVVDGAKAGLLIAVEEYNKQITPYVTNFRVQNNTVIRCGDITNQNLGGIWLWGNVQSSPMSGVVSDNMIIDPVRHGISVVNWVPKEVTIRNNLIDEPGPDGQRIYTTLRNDFSPVISENKDYVSKTN